MPKRAFQDLFQNHITSISQFLNQPQCNRLAKFLTWIRMMRMNSLIGQSDGSLQGPETDSQSINQSKTNFNVLKHEASRLTQSQAVHKKTEGCFTNLLAQLDQYAGLQDSGCWACSSLSSKAALKS